MTWLMLEISCVVMSFLIVGLRSDALGLPWWFWTATQLAAAVWISSDLIFAYRVRKLADEKWRRDCEARS